MEARGPAGENWKPERALPELGQDRDGSEPPSIECPDQSHGQGLQGDRHGNHRNLRMGGGRKNQRSQNHRSDLPCRASILSTEGSGEER